MSIATGSRPARGFEMDAERPGAPARLRILDVSPRVVVPPLRGAAARTVGLLRALAARHDVRGFSQARVGSPRGEVEPVPGYRELRYGHPLAVLVTELSERAWVRSPITSGIALRLTRPRLLRRLLAWADVVLVDFPWQFEHCRRLAAGTPLVLNTHNLERVKFASWSQAVGRPASTPLWLASVERAERGAARGADLVLAVTAAEAGAFVERYGVDPARVVVVPNGADVERLVPAGPDVRSRARRELGLADAPIALFAASDMPPNRPALEWVRRAAERCPDHLFVVVGGSAAAGRRGNVIATGIVEDISPYLAAADVALCPIEHGAGTKIKLLESLAAGLPVIAFEEALAGTETKAGIHALVVEKCVDAIAGALRRLAEDEALAGRLGSAARSLAVDRYDWRTIGERLEAALLELVGARRPS